jgi:hypothetical protein
VLNVLCSAGVSSWPLSNHTALHCTTLHYTLHYTQYSGANRDMTVQTDRTESVVGSRLLTHSPMHPLMAATWRSAYQFRRASCTVGMPWCIIDREAIFLRISDEPQACPPASACCRPGWFNGEEISGAPACHGELGQSFSRLCSPIPPVSPTPANPTLAELGKG